MFDRIDRLVIAVHDLPVHLPAYEQQQQTASERKTDNLQHLLGNAGEQDTEHDGARDSPENHLVAHVLAHLGSGHADDDGVVAGKRQVGAA